MKTDAKGYSCGLMMNKDIKQPEFLKDLTKHKLWFDDE